ERQKSRSLLRYLHQHYLRVVPYIRENRKPARTLKEGALQPQRYQRRFGGGPQHRRQRQRFLSAGISKQRPFYATVFWWPGYAAAYLVYARCLYASRYSHPAERF